jgi:aldose sugar dehydrogenase
MWIRFALFLIVLFFSPFSSVLADESVYEVGGEKFRLEILLQRSAVIWGFDFLPQEKMIFSERSGNLILFDGKKNTSIEIKGVPSVDSRGQGGLLDVRVDPEGGENPWIYFTYSQPVERSATTALARAKIRGESLAQVQNLFSAQEASSKTNHFGSRIEFDREGHIYLTVGDRGDRHKAQDLGSHIGKVIRLNKDGSVPKDNPFVEKDNAMPEIWSWGHRNPQGLVRHPLSGELWSSEHGPRGGDEINLIKRGANYGWPLVTQGREYWGPKIGEEFPKEGIEAPFVTFTPSISPAGIAFYEGEKFPKWRGNIFLANLSGQHLRRLVVEDGAVTQQDEMLKELNLRFRQVRLGPDELLYFSTDDGKLVRLIPVKEEKAGKLK